MTEKNIELLAPAGSYETMQAAIAAGADAVYIGGQLFGARAYADNPDDNMLLDAIDYVHLRGKKLYLTVNTLLKDSEIEEQLYAYLEPLYKQGLDAVIVQDLGVMKFIQEHFPLLPIHASTQMTITGRRGAKFLEEQKNVTRVVTARELSLDEIRDIRANSSLEIESFIHGALCYSYSGQCLFSSMVGGRSGNRGRCAQPCRMVYKDSDGKNGYFISPKDLCTVEILPEIIKSGVTSLKIEGRMKKPEYTAGVVSIYRKYLDLYLTKGEKGYFVSQKDKQILLDLFNRGGFTAGYYLKHNGQDMMFTEGKDSEEKGRNEELFAKIRSKYIDVPQEKMQITGEAYVYVGQPVSMRVQFKGYDVSVEGEVVQPAQNQPMTVEKIEKQLNKLGATEFAWQEMPQVFTDDASFVSVTELNNLRRTAIDRLREEILREYRRDICSTETDVALTAVSPADRPHGKYPLYAYVEDTSILEMLVLEFADYDGFYLDTAALSREDILKGISLCKSAGKKIYIAMPHIFRKKAAEQFDNMYKDIVAAEPTGFLVRNLENLIYLTERGNKLPILQDYTMYAYNKEAREVLDRYNTDGYVLPVELNFRELCELGAENGILIAYGRIPMMISAQCVTKTTKGICTGKTGVHEQLTDRMNNVFPIKRYCNVCYNKIYNCKPLSLLTMTKEINLLSPAGIRLDFTTETINEAREVSRKFVNVFVHGASDEKELADFTRGHFKRGIG
ncbi:MAG: U32 family peptidase [Lachnospiraceae bacterium]|nr:U32 family peptidase [Lachnospiraceae bacterium]